MFKSFIYMFKDKSYWKKYLLLLIPVLIANLLINWSGTFSPTLNDGKSSPWYYILFFAGFIVMFIPYGYSINLLKSRLEKEPADELPSLNVTDNFISGAKVILAGIPLLLLMFLASFLIITINSIIPNILGGFISVLLNILMFLILLTTTFMGIAMCCRYVIKPSYLNFVNFKATAELINQDTVKYLKAALLTGFSLLIIYTLAMVAVTFLTALGYLGLAIYCVIVSILWTYQIFVLAGLFSNAVIAEKI